MSTTAEQVPDRVALTIFQGRAGDHNDRAYAGARAVGRELERRLGVEAITVGHPEPPLNVGWHEELDAARPGLQELRVRYQRVLAAGQAPISALTRCAASLATLPVVAEHFPSALVLWLDAHADLNTPESTVSGYLGGLAFSGPMGLWHTGLGGNLAPAHAILVGARDIDPPEQAVIDAGVLRLVHLGPDAPDRLREMTAHHPVYLHLDCDVLDPQIVPTDYAVENGLTLDDLQAIASALAETRVLGVEIAEFQASFEPSGPDHPPAELLDALAPLFDAADARRIPEQGGWPSKRGAAQV
jgi:arginase